MQANTLSAGHGLTWIRHGFDLWKRNPALMTFLSFGYLLLVALISVVPVVGQPAATLMMPALSLGVLNGGRAIARGQRGGPDLMLSGFRRNLPTLVTIGGIYLVGSLLALFATALGDGGLLLEAMTGKRGIDASLAEQPGFLAAVMIGTVASTPVMMAYWFAPMLAAWHDLSAPKAMVFSMIACARNWKPFLTYALGLMMIAAILPAVVIGVIGSFSPTVAALISVPLPLIMVPIVFATFYPNVRDIFGDDADADADAATGDG
ncbi:MAG: hypothetical protein KDH15_22000 [Rhodocyclaceae bacterium]|nr:hypothetical protein [Rhodocyclaceae bacterium]